MPEQGAVPKEGRDSEAVTPHWSTLSLRGLTHQKGPVTGAIHEELQPLERPNVGEFHGGLSHMGEMPYWSNVESKSHPPERK